MLLHNVCIVNGEDQLPNEILIENGRIRAIIPTGSLQKNEEKRKTIFFENAIAFPGLTNSHEHLDFNLFPQIANKTYANYREWGNDIHQNNKPAINEVLQIPQNLRTKWGVYKNLLNGFTSVVNHGDQLAIEDPFIDVHQQYTSLHSVGFEKNWKWKLNRPGKQNKPYAMHIGEGTDKLASEEIDELIYWNLFNKPLVGIHGVAMKPSQATAFKALVWCAASNYFLLDHTADIKALKQATSILFGSDSTLTAGWNIWDQIRTARNAGMLSDEELFESLTANAAAIWGWKNNGYLKDGYSADIVVAQKKAGGDNLNAFYAIQPEDILLIVQKGKICLYDSLLDDQLHRSNMLADIAFSRIKINGHTKSVIGDLPLLMQQIKQYHPTAILSPIQSIQ